MSEHDAVQDVVIVGGGAAGLSPAELLARGRQEVLGYGGETGPGR